MIKITENKIILIDNNKEIAYIEFQNLDNGTIDVLHVVVNEDFQDQGYGKIIMQELENYLKNNNKKAKLTCSFAIKYATKHEEINKFLIK